MRFSNWIVILWYSFHCFEELTRIEPMHRSVWSINQTRLPFVSITTCQAPKPTLFSTQPVEKWWDFSFEGNFCMAMIVPHIQYHHDGHSNRPFLTGSLRISILPLHTNSHIPHKIVFARRSRSGLLCRVWIFPPLSEESWGSPFYKKASVKFCES